MSIEALKEKARQHEQNEDWGEALQVYVDAINRQSDDDQPDLGLYNRAGDLSTRIGDSVGAIQYYEQAVDLYLEAELPNNAIAILKKILRNLPQRSEVFLRMGQIRAQQGFLTDARDNFLTYAERRQQEGDMDEAFRALEEFADVAPGDVEVRLALAEQLHAHERSPEALQQLSHAYHQYVGRGEGEAAQGIATRIQEIDASFVIPAADDLSGGLFETNVLGADAGFEADYDADDSVESAFDEIALDDDTEIDFAPESEIELGDGTDDEIDASDEISFESADGEVLEAGDGSEADGEDVFGEDDAFGTADEAAFESTGELAFDSPDEIAFESSDEIESPVAELDSASEEAEASMESSAFDDDADDDDDVFGFEDEDTTLDFGTAVFGDDDASTESGSFADPEEVSDGPVQAALHTGRDAVTDSDGAPVEDQDDWEIGSDIEDAFISFEGPEDQIQASASEESDLAGSDPDEGMEAADDIAAFSDFDVSDESEVSADLDAEDDLPFVSFEGSDETFETGTSAFDDEVSESIEGSEELASAESSHDGAEFEVAPLPETETAVALEEQAKVDDASEWQEADVAVEAEDDLWSELEEPEVGTTSHEDVLEDEDLEDEWIGETALAESNEAEPEPQPALTDFGAFSITELREYVSEHQSVGPAWEHLGRLSLQEGDAAGSQQAFEEAHIAYAQSNDFMSAMRCVRELLLGEPDQMVYHQRLVEYANQGDDRTLLVSAYLELADCLDRTGAPAKARAVREKVLAIDPTNRRAAAAITGASQPEPAVAEPAAPESGSSYVDLGSMVIDQTEKTTRWTVESEEPVGEADFDFQNMLAQFKAKVAENVDVGDVKAHYDLGTAYKEMGLVEEAITEFQAALRADGQNLATYEMLGQCFMDKGQPDVAIRSLKRATEMPFEVEDELLGIYYYLGRAHEELGHSSEAIEYYEKIFALDINFEDVTERLRALR